MKTVYILVLIILMILIFACMLYVHKKEKNHVKILIKLLSSSVVGIIAYILFLRSKTISLATFWDALYFWMCDILSFFMMKFIEDYTGIAGKRKIWKKLLIIAIAVDGLALLINNYTGWMFGLFEKTVEIHNSTTTFYAEQFLPPHYLHLGLCYIMIAYSMGILIYKINNSGLLHKRKYFFILIPFAGIIIINAFCYSQKFPIDVSVALYAILACSICYCTYALIPRSILLNAQTYVMDSIDNGVLFFDEEGTCIYANRTFTEWGRTNGENALADVIEYLKALPLSKKNENTLSDRWVEEASVDGEKRIINIQYHELADKKANILGSYYIVEDKTEEYKAHEEESYRAKHDFLTGLYNRTYFFEKADEEIQNNPHTKKYLIVSNIKDFKLVNNVFGKDYGDELLCRQADLIRQFMMSDSFCGRIYGDKFAMLVRRDTFRSSAFQQAINELQNFTMKINYKVFYHIGVYDITDINESAETLYNRVNMVMSTVSNDYDRTFVECSEEELRKIVERRNMISEFDNAINNNQFVMYLQPQVNANGRAVGAEALIRWQHPQKGLLFPGDFIEIFEDAGLIYKLDIYIWHLAARKIAEWNSRGYNEAYISVNISTKDFYYLNIYEEMVKIISEYKINPKNLKLEITESALILEESSVFKTINDLRDYGFEVEIDDFGSGYSSFNMLKDIGVDVLKIDRIFLRETQNHEKSRMILNTIIALAKRMGIGIVTEGVEKESQLNMLEEMGCSIFQGYYFDKPLPIDTYEDKYLC